MIKLFTPLLIVIALLLTVNVHAQTNRANNKKSVAYRASYQRMATGNSANHTFEIREGTLWGWGRNTFGQLGDGTIINRNSPVQIGTDTKWVSISAGIEHTVGLKSDGTLWAWGRNGAGQLGDGSNINRATPVQIGIDDKWISIITGDSHTLGLKSDGTMWAWGGNYGGQLGDGTIINKTLPVQTGTDNKWVSMAAGSNQSIGLKSDGTLWAWEAMITVNWETELPQTGDHLCRLELTING